ncbi:MAG: universal stress protein [Ahrensia sp.]|nr:universal stress protein [Ahrensia sp.]
MSIKERQILMLPKTLFTVTGSEQPTDAVARAIDLSRENACHLAVLVIGIALPASATAYGAVPAETWSEEREKGRVAATQKATEIGAMMKEAEISGDVATYYCDEGQIADIVGMRARYTDLGLVLPSPDQDTRLTNKTLEGFVYQSARPFLFVPGQATATLKPKRVLVGWNSTREAASAVHDAMDMLGGAETVHVAIVDPVAGEFDQGEEPGSDIAAYLARQGVKVTVDVLASGGRSAADALLQHAADIDADVIVAGAYGHSRLREFLFGGATRDLLANEGFPILMAH